MRECTNGFISEHVRTTNTVINAINTRMETNTRSTKRERTSEGKALRLARFLTRGVADLIFSERLDEKPDVFLI